jgi:non-ribosomal peptide synthetase component E (peptide arylation enzyme)
MPEQSPANRRLIAGRWLRWNEQRTGERVCVVIVPRSQPGPDVAALRDFLGKLKVARFKTPEQVELWETLPKNDAGKVLKNVIRATLTGKR